MPEDMTALIERQKAEQAAREAQPGRYDGIDGISLKDLARRVELEHQNLASWRAVNDVEPAIDPEARLRAVAAANPRAAAAFGLLNQGVPVIVVLDENGAPMTEPTRDVDLIASWFEPGGQYATCWPGVPCGEQGDRLGLLLTGEGVGWFKDIATIHRPSRVERLMTSLDSVDALGVPGTYDDWDDEPRQRPDELRATLSARLWLVEHLPAHLPVVQSWTGSLRGLAGQAAMAAGRSQRPRELSGMVWSWPRGVTLPVGRELRKGVLSLAAVPAEGAELTLGGVSFVVGLVPALLSPPPDWLVSALEEVA